MAGLERSVDRYVMSGLVSVASMRSLLLCALIVHFTFGGEYVKVDPYKGKECNKALQPTSYQTFIDPVIRKSYRYGKSYYLWGWDLKGGRLLYCARVTSENKPDGEVYHSLSVPKEVLKGKVIRIQVIDQKLRGSGYVALDGGGVSLSSVSLAFRTKNGKPMDYVVAIFGKQ